MSERLTEELVALADGMTPEDLPSDLLTWIADEIGVAPTVRLICEFAGNTFYLPSAYKGSRARLPRKLAQKDGEPLTEDDMPSPVFRRVAEKIGAQKTAAILLGFAGVILYLPVKFRTYLVQKWVRMHYDGHNARELAITCGVSEPTIFKWLRRGPLKPQKNDCRRRSVKA